MMHQTAAFGEAYLIYRNRQKFVVPVCTNFRSFLTQHFFAQVNSTDSVRFKNNFCRVNMMSYFGSPADGVLSPYSTSLYGFFDKNLSYIPMEAQAVYLDDLFGLQTMMIAGRLSRHGLALCGEDLQDICFAIVDLKCKKKTPI
jgi:hypothetical protein